MSDKEADLQIKEQLELYSDFIKFAWDSLDDNILTDDDNENVDMSLEAFFNLVKIACFQNFHLQSVKDHLTIPVMPAYYMLFQKHPLE